MDRKHAIDLARMMALASDEEHDYLPKSRGDAQKFKPHEWVIAAIMAAAAHDDDQA